ncbi:sensor histidine kinase [Leptolyngbya sp. FACHB-60]|uniref:sensor histidine kinase n=1 Tax=Cyanophyceae TaxID=3028117 RepID=UPI001684D523|nr:sensor histidine kinase [Leptolyngbya sp. FACHB-60]MBD1917939.1 sensor histidine kinase [Phormidium sp. FACHB-77]MBD2049719.1 sensor histidine kinase [Leptolyngbya sp. FACHB-60]
MAAPQPAPISSGGQALSLKWYLVLLVAGTLLPVVLFAAAVVLKLSSQEQSASERLMLREARNLASTVESEFSSTTRTLQVLATSEQLYQGDLDSFHNEAKRLTATQPTWLTTMLLSPDGQEMLNSRHSLSRPLSYTHEPKSLERLIETRQPTVGDLGQGQSGHDFTFPVLVPVIQQGSLQYILTAVITPETLSEVVVARIPVEGEWTRVIVDGEGIVVARTRNPERFVGKSGTPSFLQRVGSANEGVYRDTSLEGEQVYVAFSRVHNTSWTAAVTVPVDVIQKPVQRAMWLVVGPGLALLLVSGVGAFLLSRQISRSITKAAMAAEALANGDPPQVSTLSIREIVLLGQSLEFAANLLSQREQERTENLMRAESAREEAEAANRIKDEFLAVLSHELRTPLNPIVGWSSLLRTGRLDPKKTAFALEAIERNAKLQTQLIEDLLDVTRIMQGKLNFNMMAVNVGAIVEAAIETVRLTAEAKSITIQTALDLTVGQVLGDPTRLQQVFWNLLSNAIKFTNEGGEVIVRLSRIGSQAQVQVSDSGKGIHPNFIAHVFEYFRQEDGTTTRKFGGLGLGLAIVRNLVELHGGTVQAESPGEGQGATFTVRLPLLEREG